MEILPVFQFFECYRIFLENLDNNLRKFENLHLSQVRRADPSEASKFIKNQLEKLMEITNILKICMNSERLSFITMRI